MNTSINDERVGRVVSDLIEAAGLTRKKVAEETGIPRVTLIRRLQGQASFQLVELRAVAELLGTTAAAVLAKAEQVAA